MNEITANVITKVIVGAVALGTIGSVAWVTVKLTN